MSIKEILIYEIQNAMNSDSCYGWSGNHYIKMFLIQKRLLRRFSKKRQSEILNNIAEGNYLRVNTSLADIKIIYDKARKALR